MLKLLQSDTHKCGGLCATEESERLHVDFMQRALVDDAIRAVTEEFLLIG